jgi:hypothetical protein
MGINPQMELTNEASLGIDLTLLINCSLKYSYIISH